MWLCCLTLHNWTDFRMDECSAKSNEQYTLPFWVSWTILGYMETIFDFFSLPFSLACTFWCLMWILSSRCPLLKEVWAVLALVLPLNLLVVVFVYFCFYLRLIVIAITNYIITYMAAYTEYVDDAVWWKQWELFHGWRGWFCLDNMMLLRIFPFQKKKKTYCSFFCMLWRSHMYVRHVHAYAW